MAKFSISTGLLSAVSEQLPGLLFDGAPLQPLEAGELLFAAGDAGNGCYRLEEGLLKVEVASPRGEARIIALLGPTALVGELSLIDGLPRSASVVALRDSVLRVVSREAFAHYTRAHPDTYRTLVTVLSRRLRDADATIAAASFLSVRARVARALVELAEHVGEEAGEGRIVLDHGVRQGDLAAMAGVARENVSRVFSDFRKRKLVTLRSNRICLNDISAIERMIEAG